MGITMTATGAFRETGASFFFIPKGALTHHCPKGSGGIPPVGRAVRSSRSIRRMLLQRGQTMPQFCKPPSLSVRLADGFRLVCLFAANRCPLPGQPATRLRKPATGSFAAVMDDASTAPSIFFCLGKRNKTAPCRGQKGSERLWRSITWKQRS